MAGKTNTMASHRITPSQQKPGSRGASSFPVMLSRMMLSGRASRILLLGILENLSLYNIVVLAITVSIVIILGIYINNFLRKLTKKK